MSLPRHFDLDCFDPLINWEKIVSTIFYLQILGHSAGFHLFRSTISVRSNVEF